MISKQKKHKACAASADFPQPSHGRHAFTLIELLVVIAIISILSSMLMSVISRARQEGRKAVCLSNLRQMGFALQMYSTDYDGYFPESSRNDSTWPDTAWAGILLPYIANQKAFICPADKETFDVGGIDVSYGYNTEFAEFPRAKDSIKNQTNYLVLADGNQLEIDPFDVSGQEYEEKAVGYDFEYRHSGGINYLAVDGHAEWSDFIPANDPRLANLDGGL